MYRVRYRRCNRGSPAEGFRSSSFKLQVRIRQRGSFLDCNLASNSEEEEDFIAGVQGSDGIEVFVTKKLPFFNLALVDRSSAIFDIDQLTYDQSIAFLDKPAEDWVVKEVLGIKSTRDFVFDGSYAG